MSTRQPALIPSSAAVVWSGASWASELDNLIREHEKFAKERAEHLLGRWWSRPLHLTCVETPGEPVFFWWWVE